MGHIKISIEDYRGKTRIRFTHDGKRFSFCPGLDYGDSTVDKLVNWIVGDIERGKFDDTLLSYRSNVSKRKLIYGNFIISQYDYWVDNYINGDKDNPYYYDPRSLLMRFGDFYLENFLRLFNAEKVSPKTYNNRLYCLRRFFTYLVKSHKIAFNPLDGVNRKVKSLVEDDARLPLTSDEIFTFLEAIRTDKYNSPSSRYKHSFYYPFLYFIFNTGCRNSEVIALRVRNVNLIKNYVLISESLVRTKAGTHSSARKRKHTKTNKKRIIPLSPEMKDVLLPIIVNKNPDDLVFTSYTNKCIDDRMLQRRIFKPVMIKLGYGNKVLYCARHSFSTIAIEEGFTPSEVSKIVGNSPETLIRNYLHLTNIPKKMPNIMGNIKK